MKYLAFDIEAANGFKPYSICSIGIVTADENFRVTYRTNIWINPKTAYNLDGTRKNVGIDLHLDKKLLDASPDFPHRYQLIKSYMCSGEYLVVGHAVDADVRMLNAACQRYNLPSLDFKFICSQLLYKLYRGEKDVKALSKIAAELGISYREHNSEEDAWMSLQTLRFLTRDSGLTVEQLMEKYQVRMGSNSNFVLQRPVSLSGQTSKKQLTQQAVENIKRYVGGVTVTGSRFKGKTFCIARSLELSQSPLLYRVLDVIVSQGGKYSSKLVRCDVYVKNQVQSQVDVMREKRIAELALQGVKTVEAEVLAEGEDYE